MINADEHVLEYVDAYLHGVLPNARDRELVANHCAACPICRVALAEARRRQEAMQALPPIEAAESLIRTTLERVERYQRRRSKLLRRGTLVAAVVLLALGSANLYFSRLAPTPFNLRIMGQSELLVGADAALRVLVSDARDRSPQPDVPVEIQLIGPDRKSVRLASFTTDRFGSGTVAMRTPDWSPGQYTLRVTARPAGYTESIERPIKLHRSWQLMLSSDKPVYQPGQVIHLRSLALMRPQGKPVAGQQAEYSIADPKGNVIFRKRDVTSRFGIAAADCPLADEIVTGSYQVRCEVGDTTSTITVEVKKYVLPKFKIAVDLDEPFYQPGQKVHGTLSARYFFGKPLPAGTAQITVETVDPATGRFGDPIATTAATTDAQGKAAFEFVLPQSLFGRPQDGGDARFRLTATVADSAGQKQSVSVSRVVTQRPIRIDVIPEAGALVPGLPNTVYFLTTYADGRPAVTRIAVSGFDREITTSAMGAGSLDFTPTPRDVSWVVRATDAAGLSSSREVVLEAQPSDGQFLVRTDKAVYDGGQTIHVLALGGGQEPLFLDVIKDGQTILTDTVAMAAGRGDYQIDLPPQVCGTLQLCAYRFGDASLPVMQTRVVYVRPANGLKVDAHFDRAEYRPGQQAKLSLTVTDRQGKPVPGAVSLEAVDEAVYSVLGSAPGLQPVFSSLEQKILKPIYAIYAWSPDLDANLPADKCEPFERALFAKAGTARTDRDAILKQLIRDFAEGNQRILRVLDRPDWEQLAQNMPGMEKAIPLLKGEGSVYSLRESTYPAKAHEIETLRNARLEQFTMIWIGLAVAAGFVGFVAFVRSLGGTLSTAVIVIIVLGILVSMLMPAVQSARESGRRAAAQNDLHQIGLAVEAADAAGANLVPQDTPAAGPPVRVREWFPETLLWRPELITDDHGRASLTVDLADSITTWRLAASAISADGQLGSTQSPLRVFQPFFVDLNLPVSLTRGDEVAVPAVVYNYLDKPLAVELRLDDAPWFERIDPATHKLDLAAGEVRSASYRLRVTKVGRHELTVRASGGGVADAIKRTIEVVPDGRRVETTASGTLGRPAEIAWSVPADAIDGSVKARVKLFPSTFSQLVDGLEAIFQRPYGCFEQTSSTTYPNVLALDYLHRTKKSVPQVEATAQQYIHLGNQRLLSFEVAGGGFDWFGHPPANQTLTAYGLMEFCDMARVHDVDPKLIERTRAWLLAQQAADGSWAPASQQMHEDPAGRAGGLRRLSTTAYIAWAVFGGEAGKSPAAAAAAAFLLRYQPNTIDDPYVLAQVTNALLAIEPGDRRAQPYLERLEALHQRSADGKLAWWELGINRRTAFYGAGLSGNVETTALATLALIEGHAAPDTVRAALSWLVTQKDGCGAWYSTQATVLALKALLAGTDRPLGEARARQIDIAIDGKKIETVVIPADQADVMQQVDLSARVASGRHRLEITDRSAAATGYQATLVCHVPGTEPTSDDEPLAIQLDYDKTTLAVDDRIAATATVTNKTAEAIPMVIVDLPIPAGFAVEVGDLEALRASAKIAKYQLTPRSVIVYLRALEPSARLALGYHLRATMPVKVAAPAARAYEYYNPAHQAATTPILLTVAAADRPQ